MFGLAERPFCSRDGEKLGSGRSEGVRVRCGGCSRQVALFKSDPAVKVGFYGKNQKKPENFLLVFGGRTCSLRVAAAARAVCVWLDIRSYLCFRRSAHMGGTSHNASNAVAHQWAA